MDVSAVVAVMSVPIGHMHVLLVSVGLVVAAVDVAVGHVVVVVGHVGHVVGVGHVGHVVVVDVGVAVVCVVGDVQVGISGFPAHKKKVLCEHRLWHHTAPSSPAAHITLSPLLSPPHSPAYCK